MPERLEDFMAAEPLIVERLRQQVPELAEVRSFGELEGVAEQQQRTPAALVGLDDYEVVQAAADGARVRIRQLWSVLVLVRNARAQAAAEVARQEAGPLVARCLRVLQGWRPAETLGALEPVSSPYAPTYRDGGLAYFPLAFATELKSYSDEE